jgi:hypothetical protein
MINWANIVVGSKVPMLAEYLVNLNKPAVFNISGNAEIHKITFKGVPIKSSKQLKEAIEKCEGVKCIKGKTNFTEETNIIFVHDGREFGEYPGNR